MYAAQVPPVAYAAPWDIGFDARMALLLRGTPRAAYFYATPDTSTFRYRAYNIAQALGAQRAGAAASWFTAADLPRIGRVLDACDVLVICRNSLYDDSIARLAALARARGRRILFDCDDLVFDPAYAHLLVDTLGVDKRNDDVWNYWFAYIGRVGATFALCDAALTTNSVLAAHAARWSGKPARVIANFLNREQQDISERMWQAKAASKWAGDGRRHIGYFSGSPSHNRDFAMVAPAIARLMDADPGLWFRGVGFLEPGPDLARHAARIETIPLQDFMNLQREIGAVELNIAPLMDNAFTNCKSELKWFEAAVVGALTVATPTFTFRGAIRHGQTGFLAESHAWEDVLTEALRGFDARRGAMAEAARDEARERFGWDRQAAAITAALFEGW